MSVDYKANFLKRKPGKSCAQHAVVASYYHLCTVLQQNQNLGDHKFIDHRDVDTDVTRWTITKDTDF
jgi:hypothetical protein